MKTRNILLSGLKTDKTPRLSEAYTNTDKNIDASILLSERSKKMQNSKSMMQIRGAQSIKKRDKTRNGLESHRTLELPSKPPNDSQIQIMGHEVNKLFNLPFINTKTPPPGPKDIPNT